MAARSSRMNGKPPGFHRVICFVIRATCRRYRGIRVLSASYYTRFHLKNSSKKKVRLLAVALLISLWAENFRLDKCYLIKTYTFQATVASLLPLTTKSCENYFARRMSIEQNLPLEVKTGIVAATNTHDAAHFVRRKFLQMASLACSNPRHRVSGRREACRHLRKKHGVRL
ncbi:hypothetical protein IscW_ISCW009371 [Ixodes scapularis]|uniref:Uncharacterized protein n=1 Tax=Ixodes scapularis TaxID=6945 RepID=B7PYF1_IXOSC|nr:hypothetical protein IscW_ISCW009371 [Ixodes scapularis]|eukprot:XP_002403047.1 hypothetical protein IscW_ISCW009371 [Ixodes scapularis]